MINKTERTKLKKVLKNKWIDDVLKKTIEKELVTKHGNNYDKTYVSQVFNGVQSNLNIENCIREVYNERKLEQSNKIVKLID
mgnify:CR=1 FL=1